MASRFTESSSAQADDVFGTLIETIANTIIEKNAIANANATSVIALDVELLSITLFINIRNHLVESEVVLTAASIRIISLFIFHYELIFKKQKLPTFCRKSILILIFF